MTMSDRALEGGQLALPAAHQLDLQMICSCKQRTQGTVKSLAQVSLVQAMSTVGVPICMTAYIVSTFTLV